MTRNEYFIQHLYKEKELHKEHRHKHILYKMALTGSLFGLSQFSNNPQMFNYFLYIIPMIAFVHDIYIAGEHFKVQRVGMFIKNLGVTRHHTICFEEIAWERFLEKRREKWAYKASLLYSLIISGFCAYSIYAIDTKVLYTVQYRVWLVICGSFILLILTRSIRIGEFDYRIYGFTFRKERNKKMDELIRGVLKAAETEFQKESVAES